MVFSWQMAEQLAAAHLRSLGFADARVTAGGSDGGVDVISARAAAQVKYLSASVGSPDIQRLRGAAHSYEFAIFYSSSGYSAAARVIADASDVALFEYDEQNNVLPVNTVATALANAPAVNVDQIDRVLAAMESAKEFSALRRALRLFLVRIQEGISDGSIPLDGSVPGELAIPAWATDFSGVVEHGQQMHSLDVELSDRWKAALAISDLDEVIALSALMVDLSGPMLTQYRAMPDGIGELFERCLVDSRVEVDAQ